MNKYHNEFYQAAKAYDVAFSWRDQVKECDFLEAVVKKYGKGNLSSFLEIAAGPGEHALEMSKRGIHAAALDLCPAMVSYGRSKAKAAGQEYLYEQGDMREFDLLSQMGERFTGFDLTVLLMSSCSYLLTNDDVYKNFQAVAKNLKSGGLYLLEMPHPRDVFGVGKSTCCDWKIEKDGMKVHTVWGAEDDEFDPITGITQCSVKMTISEGDKTQVITEVAPQRGFIWTELTALVEASGVFEVAGIYGAMDITIPFSNAKEAWRLVPVLRKK